MLACDILEADAFIGVMNTTYCNEVMLVNFLLPHKVTSTNLAFSFTSSLAIALSFVLVISSFVALRHHV